jgi:para-aminobenzoate synthetase component 1
VYQVNLCRILSAPIVGAADVAALDAILQVGNPAPHSGFIRIPGCEVVSASPELFLARDEDTLRSGPIKGTAPAGGDLLDKDVAENVMITDLVRNDLSRVARPGGVSVPEFLQREEHPGIAHLVSYVQADLVPGVSWRDILEATFPPGSVTGAPKYSALQLIKELEPESRGSYCGAFGWIAGQRGSLGVTIRTFWKESDVFKFGTGAGITWLSDPVAEWQETELKARRLCALAAGRDVP